ncbi:MAG: DUF2752 domain-containing protein [Flavobacteriales bacterium]|nr:DUF2752 domain-containing protein [Flavobacteriales bacterium]
MPDKTTANNKLKPPLVYRYILHNKLFSLFFLFVGMSILFKAFVGVDFTIPCPIKLATGHECLGCGITTACTHLVRMEFTQAVHANALAIPLVGAFIIYLIWDVRNFLGH